MIKSKALLSTKGSIIFKCWSLLINYVHLDLPDRITPATKSGGTDEDGRTLAGKSIWLNRMTSPFWKLVKSTVTFGGMSSLQTHSMNLLTFTTKQPLRKSTHWSALIKSIGTLTRFPALYFRKLTLTGRSVTVQEYKFKLWLRVLRHSGYLNLHGFNCNCLGVTICWELSSNTRL